MTWKQQLLAELLATTLAITLSLGAIKLLGYHALVQIGNLKIVNINPP
jgi:hypothetical protein